MEAHKAASRSKQTNPRRCRKCYKRIRLDNRYFFCSNCYSSLPKDEAEEALRYYA